MDGIHDLGGRQGYGPIDVERTARAVSCALGGAAARHHPRLHAAGVFSIDWFRHVRECIEPADYLTAALLRPVAADLRRDDGRCRRGHASRSLRPASRRGPFRACRRR